MVSKCCFLWLPLFWGSHPIWLVVFHMGSKIRSLQPKPIIEAKSPRKCVSYLIFPTQVFLAVLKCLGFNDLSLVGKFLPPNPPNQSPSLAFLEAPILCESAWKRLWGQKPASDVLIRLRVMGYSNRWRWRKIEGCFLKTPYLFWNESWRM